MNLNVSSKVELNNGVEIPWLGLGVYRSPEGEITKKAILSAIEVGYRHIDSAKIYRNERTVGKAVRASELDREEIFVTTKLWNSDHGYDAALKACDISLKTLGFEYIDLYLIHWPVEKKRLDSWRALEKLVDDGKVRAIGVSNYMVHHLTELLDNCTIVPAINQIELSPYNFTYRQEIIDLCRTQNIYLEGYSPLTKARKLNDPKLVEIANRYSKTPAQILLRYLLDQEVIILPKSVNPVRIKENADLFDFKLSSSDFELLTSFNENLITGWDPTDAP